MATTVPESAWGLLRGQLAFLREEGFDVVLVSSPGPLLDAVGRREGVRTIGIPMSRAIRPWADLRSLVALVCVFRAERPVISMVGTPKAGLLAGLAARLTRVPRRVYLLRGLRLETTRGVQRLVLWACERIAAASAHQVVCVSRSLRDEARALRILRRGQGTVLGAGGSNGVSVPVPVPTADTAAERRRALGLSDTDNVFGYVGRITVDKGVRELLTAFNDVSVRLPEAVLVVAGNADGDDVDRETLQALRAHPRVRFLGWLDDPAHLYPALDVFVLPTYREGLPTVCLEASAAGIPVVTTEATGARDAVRHGSTGLRIPARDAGALADAMLLLADDVELRRAMGAAGRRFVLENFTNEVVWAQLRDFLTETRGTGRDGHTLVGAA
ncbi:glycosyltransferase family 4 protein [Geodermatophilus sp. SYSU D00815]